MDFMRGPHYQKAGNLLSPYNQQLKKDYRGLSPMLKPVPAVVTTRGHVHYVATEYGIVNLYGKKTWNSVHGCW